MKKLVIFLMLSVIINCDAVQDHFFYNNREKMVLYPNPEYISVKFNNDVDESVQNMIIQNVLGQYIKSKDIFRVTQKNQTRSNTFIIQLKKGVNPASLEAVITGLQASGQVRYVGSAFSINDKIVHLTTDEVIVKFKIGVSGFDIHNLNSLFKTTVIDRVYPDENIFLLSIRSKGQQGTDNAFDVSNKYSLTQFVDFAQPNFIRMGMLCFVPNDTMLPMMWNIKNTGNNYPGGIIHGTPGCDLNMEPAWDITTGNHKVLIGIIDTGVDTGHVDLKANLCDRSLWYNSVQENQFPIDTFNHGTAESGIAAAVGNNVAGTCGIAWNCSIMPVQVFSGSAYTTDLILGKGLNWAWMHGADVLNNSWGGGINSPFITHAMQDAKNFGRNGKGCVICAGSGNVDSSGVYYPSVLPEVMSIGGISPCNQRKSPTSCDMENWGADYGEGLSVVAPCTALGCTTVDGLWHFYCNGTSGSTTQVTAIGALILSKNINLSADSVRMIIERTARKVGNYSYNVSKPNGMWNNEMGYGIPDVRAALDFTPQGPQIIYDQVPPVIKVTPPQSGIYNSPIVINATITDNEFVAPGNNMPRLYYNISSSPLTYIIQGISNSNNIYTFTIPQNGPGLSYGMSMHYYIAAQDTSSNGNIATYPPGGRGLNSPGTFPPPRKLFLQNTNYYDTTIFSTQVPIIFSSVKETTVVSLTNVPINKTILGVRCLININHNYDEDITVSLLSPSTTEIVLTSGLGHNGQGYINTNFNDYSSPSIMDTSLRAPFTGTFSPVEKLWLMNGENANGNWMLKIVDNSGGDNGRLNAWSVTLRFSSDRDISQVPSRFELLNSFPNPFNPVTRISFNVPYRARVKIIIYDILGKEVYKPLDDFQSPQYADFVDFDINSVRRNGGSGIASGVYFYSLFADDKFIEAKRMVLAK